MNETLIPHPNTTDLLDSNLAEIGIPPRPAILEQIALESRREEPDFRHIAMLIGRDVSLAAGLIKMANSAYFGYRRKARNVHEALLMLGLDTTTRAVANLTLRKVLTDGLNLDRFWDASDRIAQLSGWLVQTLGLRIRVPPEDAHTFGLFRDCGIPIMMRKFPNYHATLSEANQEASRLFTDVEESRHPTNHALVGSLLAQNWWLTETMSQAIRHHHDPALFEAEVDATLAGSRCLIAVAQLAEYLQQSCTGQSLTREWDKLGASCLRELGLEEDSLTRLQADAQLFLASLEPL